MPPYALTSYPSENLPSAPSVAGGPWSPEQRSILPGKRVLIVEDEGLTQAQLRKLMTNAGMKVVGSAVNGAQGLEIALRERPDLVLMDINMPVMDGLEATRRLLAEMSVCVVMLTAFSDQETRSRAWAFGASGYILKPVDRTILLPQLESAYLQFEHTRRSHLQ
ncbi:MAG: response regulator [Capsulimonadales bacterium]|nr:response regulator [Capsulimonadales bacterium]